MIVHERYAIGVATRDLKRGEVVVQGDIIVEGYVDVLVERADRIADREAELKAQARAAWFRRWFR